MVCHLESSGTGCRQEHIYPFFSFYLPPISTSLIPSTVGLKISMQEVVICAMLVVPLSGTPCRDISDMVPSFDMPMRDVSLSL